MAEHQLQLTGAAVEAMLGTQVERPQLTAQVAVILGVVEVERQLRHRRALVDGQEMRQHQADSVLQLQAQMVLLHLVLMVLRHLLRVDLHRLPGAMMRQLRVLQWVLPHPVLVLGLRLLQALGEITMMDLNTANKLIVEKSE